MRGEKGFTLIELILYIAIVTIVVSAMIPFAWNVIEGGVKSTTEQEVFSNARFVSERIKYEIRNASGITSVGASSISLTNFSPDTTTVIDLNVPTGKIRINKNGTGAVNLNSNDTTATALTFTNYTSVDNKTKNIQFNFTLGSNFGQTRQEYQQTATIEGDAELRSN